MSAPLSTDEMLIQKLLAHLRDEGYAALCPDKTARYGLAQPVSILLSY